MRGRETETENELGRNNEEIDRERTRGRDREIKELRE